MTFGSDRLDDHERRGLSQLYGQYSDWLSARLRHLGVTGVDDVVQETYLRIAPYQARGEVRHPKSLLLRIGSWTTTDMQVGWTPSGSWGEGFSLTASVRNVFDADPPFYDAITGIGFDAGQADPLGRTFALQLTKRW